VRWAVFSNDEVRSCVPKNAKLLNEFVNEFVNEFDELVDKMSCNASLDQQGVDMVNFADAFETRHSPKRVFHNVSASAAVMHFSAHSLHLIAFVNVDQSVSMWAVKDSVSSVFDFLVQVQTESRTQVLAPAVNDFVTKVTALALSKICREGTGDRLAQRITLLNQVAMDVVSCQETQFSRFFRSGFWWHVQQFQAGLGSSIGSFVRLFLTRDQESIGRRSKIAEHPGFLACLEETVEDLCGVAADARVKSGISYKARGSNASSHHFAAHLKAKYNIFLSSSTVLTYLRPRNIASLAAKRHSLFALPIRPVFDAKAVAKVHVNCHYCCSAVKTAMLLAQSPALRDETFCFSLDAKSHVKTGNDVRATMRPVKAWLPEKRKDSYVVADHDFLALKKYCLILNGFLSISPFETKGRGDVSRRGQVLYVVRPWEFRPDSAVQQLDDFLFSLSYISRDETRLKDFLLGRDMLKIVEIADGGPATKPSNSLVRLTSAFLFHIFSLDLLVRRTNSPETSKLNPVERCHSVVSQSLGGSIPHDNGDEEGMYFAAGVVCDKLTFPGLSYSGKPVLAVAWCESETSFVPKVLHDFVNASAAERKELASVELVLSDGLLSVIQKLRRPKPRAGICIRDLLDLLSDGRHGSASSVDSTISRCNDQHCNACGGLWQGKPWTLRDNGSLPMPIPSDTPGRYLPLTDLLQSTLCDGDPPSWRPSDLIAETIDPSIFLRGLQDLSISSNMFQEVRCFLWQSIILILYHSLLCGAAWRQLRVLNICWQSFSASLTCS
jgi:hypothetical protein